MEHAGGDQTREDGCHPWFYAARGGRMGLVWDLTCPHSDPDGLLDLPNPLIF